MALTLLGKKLGMTRIFGEGGASIPVTVIECGPCVVTQLRTKENDGYTAVQIGWGEKKVRRATIPQIGHDAKAGTTPKRVHREFKVDAKKLGEFTVGQEITVEALSDQKYVDVTGRSKGKGFQGVMKRWNFKGMFASHGTERKHRSPGSIGGLCSNRGFGGGLKKGKRMAGHMGDDRVTVRSLDVVRIDAKQNLILVKGPVPGANNGVVAVRVSTRLNRSKQKKLAEAKAK
ncbi:MAG: 50S ribosomal protein L3 [Phycisphaerales bacterium]|nr:50S ribosomal protein L3 [Phycisphaerales bacterium]